MVGLTFIAFLEERECVEKLGRIRDDLSPLFFLSLQAIQGMPTLVLQSQQRLHKLQFLQKLGCQKPCWVQARLSSLVNKQVALSSLLCSIYFFIAPTFSN